MQGNGLRSLATWLIRPNLREASHLGHGWVALFMVLLLFGASGRAQDSTPAGVGARDQSSPTQPPVMEPDIPDASTPPTPAAPSAASAAPSVPLYSLEGNVTASTAAPSPMAQPSVDEPWPGLSGPRKFAYQRSFALAAHALTFNGFGLGVHAGAPRLGLDLSAGYLPIFSIYTPEDQSSTKFHFFNSWQLNAAAYVGLHQIGSRTDFGLLVGYKYDTLLLHGVGAGVYFQIDLARHWALQLSIAPFIFPESNRRIREKWPLPSSTGSVGGGLSALQIGPGVSLQFFP